MNDDALWRELAAINKNLGELNQGARAALQVLDAHNRVLYGNGEGGIIREVAILNENEATERWYWRSIVGVIVGLALNALWQLLGKRV